MNALREAEGRGIRAQRLSLCGLNKSFGAVKVVKEKHRAVISKLDRAIPVSPVPTRGVIEVQVAYAADLLRACRNGILDHQVARFGAVQF